VAGGCNTTADADADANADADAYLQGVRALEKMHAGY